MRIISAKVTNFGSYGELEFDFTNQGLSLISGPTGSGKSTLCDIIPWILFGVTSKNGAVDDIRSWNTNEPTKGTLYLDTMTISRSRGKSSKDNDLMFWPVDGVVTRGKDIPDTQKLINGLLGMDAELYLSGAYLHEFSQTSAFFTTSAKNRRQLTEQLADLSLAIKLNDNITTYKREVKKEKELLEKEQAVLKGKIEHTRELIQNSKSKIKSWKNEQETKREKLIDQSENFEEEKATAVKKLKKSFADFEDDRNAQIDDFKNKIDQLISTILPQSYFEESKISTEILIDKCDKEKCPECGNAVKADKKMFYMRQLNDWKTQEKENAQKTNELKIARATIKLLTDKGNPYKAQIDQEILRKNTYAVQIADLENEKNPYELIHAEHSAKYTELQANLNVFAEDVESFAVELDDLEVLSQVIDDLRARLITNTITGLQNLTNKFLAEYFDAELRVKFTVKDNDKLDVEITKDGNYAVYSQLSKGQRQLLKLCFGLSVMQSVSNHNGISFNAIFLDEFADGLDEALKVKAFHLLEHLATQYDSVFAIDHSENLKSMFTKKYEVTLENGLSRLCEA